MNEENIDPQEKISVSNIKIKILLLVTIIVIVGTSCILIFKYIRPKNKIETPGKPNKTSSDDIEHNKDNTIRQIGLEKNDKPGNLKNNNLEDRSKIEDDTNASEDVGDRSESNKSVKTDFKLNEIVSEPDHESSPQNLHQSESKLSEQLEDQTKSIKNVTDEFNNGIKLQNNNYEFLEQKIKSMHSRVDKVLDRIFGTYSRLLGNIDKRLTPLIEFNKKFDSEKKKDKIEQVLESNINITATIQNIKTMYSDCAKANIGFFKKFDTKLEISDLFYRNKSIFEQSKNKENLIDRIKCFLLKKFSSLTSFVVEDSDAGQEQVSIKEQNDLEKQDLANSCVSEGYLELDENKERLKNEEEEEDRKREGEEESIESKVNRYMITLLKITSTDIRINEFEQELVEISKNIEHFSIPKAEIDGIIKEYNEIQTSKDKLNNKRKEVSTMLTEIKDIKANADQLKKNKQNIKNNEQYEELIQQTKIFDIRFDRLKTELETIINEGTKSINSLEHQLNQKISNQISEKIKEFKELSENRTKLINELETENERFKSSIDENQNLIGEFAEILINDIQRNTEGIHGYNPFKHLIGKKL